MTFQDFISQLSDAYGVKRPSSAVMREFYAAAAHIPEESRDKLLSGILHEFNFFPKVKEFAGFCKYHFPGKTEYRYEPSDSGELCPYCLNAGLIRGEWKGAYPFQNAVYSADLPCPKCGRGERFVGKYTPYFDKAFGEEYLEKIRKMREPEYKRALELRADSEKRRKNTEENKARFMLILRGWNTSIPEE